MGRLGKSTPSEILLHFWRKGVKSASKLHSLTKIPTSTIYYNLQKLKKNATTKHRCGNGRPKKITPEIAKSIGQYIRQDSSIPLKKIAAKLLEKGVNLHISTISKHLKRIGYKKSLPKTTPMLTSNHKIKRVEWAQKYLNSRWYNTLFTDETAFQLFRNTIQLWHKDERPTRCMPKDRTKVMAWGGFCKGGTTSLHCFQTIMTGDYYVEILQNHLPQIKTLFKGSWRFQHDNDPKHTNRVAKKFLEDNHFKVIDWPANSPDLNPIEIYGAS
jgi:transposase